MRPIGSIPGTTHRRDERHDWKDRQIGVYPSRSPRKLDILLSYIILRNGPITGDIVCSDHIPSPEIGG
jgi:hypothetical protein